MKEKTPTEHIEEDQDNLMTTLESIRTLLAQNEGKLNAARESISIATENTKSDSSTLLNLRKSHLEKDEEIVPVLDDIVPDDLLNNSSQAKESSISEIEADNSKDIPELDSVFHVPDPVENNPPTQDHLQSNYKQPEPNTLKDTSNSIIDEDSNPIMSKPSLAALTAKNRLTDSLDDLQRELEDSLRETLMRAMVVIEKDLKAKIKTKIKKIKAEIDK